MCLPLHTGRALDARCITAYERSVAALPTAATENEGAEGAHGALTGRAPCKAWEGIPTHAQEARGAVGARRTST